MTFKLVLTVPIVLLLCAVVAQSALQRGTRFPLGIHLGNETSNDCSDPANDGLVTLCNGSLCLCRGNEVVVIQTEEDISLLNNQTTELRQRVQALEEDVFPPLSLETVNNRLQLNNELVSRQMCNLHGVYDRETDYCVCHCSAERGCWDRLFQCSRCAAGWTGELCIGDIEAPTLTIHGDNPHIVEAAAGENYVDPGYNAWDNKDLDLTGSIVVSGDAVDMAYSGTYVIVYTVSDAAGHVVSSNRTVQIVDTTPPVVALNGAAIITIEANLESNVTDLYFTCEDNELTTKIMTSNFDTQVAQDTVGTYTVTYSCTDDVPLVSTVTRTVVVVDTTSPVITLVDGPYVQHEAGQAYNEIGMTIADNVAELLTYENDVSVVGSVPSPPHHDHDLGNYTLEYTVADASGNVADATRTVEVVDTTPPSITLNGASLITVEVDSVYNDAGAFGSDNVAYASMPKDGNDRYIVQLVSNDVNTAVEGYYTVTYALADLSGNSANNTRTVRVLGPADGSVPEKAGDSCMALFEGRHGAPRVLSSGIYWIHWMGTTAAEQVYCDMTTEGGGWTLVFQSQRAAESFPTSAAREPLDLSDNGFSSRGSKKYTDAKINAVFSNNSVHHMLIKAQTNSFTVSSATWDQIFFGTTAKNWDTDGTVIFGADLIDYHYPMPPSSLYNGLEMTNTGNNIDNARIISLGKAGISSAYQISDACNDGHTGPYLRNREWNCYQNSMKIFVRERSAQLVDGHSAAFAGRSCLHLKLGSDGPAQTDSGVYWINFNNEFPAKRVFCDMDTDGGGWTLVMETRRVSGGFPTSAASGTLTLTDQFFNAGHSKLSDAEINAVFANQTNHFMLIKSKSGDASSARVSFNQVFRFSTTKPFNTDATTPAGGIIVGADAANQAWMTTSYDINNSNILIQSARVISLGVDGQDRGFQLSNACNDGHTGPYVRDTSWNCYTNSMKIFVREF